MPNVLSMANLQYPTLKVTLNGVTSTTTISSNTFNIGRGSGNDLILTSASISQLQAKIYTIDGSNYFIHTYSPFYKMTLNGSTVVSDVQLRNNDTIIIGNVNAVFIFAEINQKVPNISNPVAGNFPIISSDGSIANSAVSPNNFYTKAEIDAKFAAITTTGGYSGAITAIIDSTFPPTAAGQFGYDPNTQHGYMCLDGSTWTQFI